MLQWIIVGSAEFGLSYVRNKKNYLKHSGCSGFDNLLAADIGGIVSRGRMVNGGALQGSLFQMTV